MSSSRSLLILVLAPLLFWSGAPVSAAETPGVRGVEVYSHRGGRAFNPENTMPAYRATLRLGTDWVDMDVVLTKDGEVLISHDPVLNPDIVRDPQGRFLAPSREALKALPEAQRGEYAGRYAAKNLTLEELRRFDVGRLNLDSAYAKFFPDQLPLDGTRMPTLREVVRWVNQTTKGKVGFQIEMKTDPSHPEYSADPKAFAAALYPILKEEGILDRAEVQAFDFRCLRELQKYDPRVRGAYLTSRENEPGGFDSFFSTDAPRAGLWTAGALVKDHGDSIPRMVKDLGGFAWEPEDAELTKSSLDEAHRLGLKVVVWTWPEKLGTTFDARMVDRLIGWGVDGIITDDPGRLMSMLASRGLRVPPRYELPPGR
jgi:glycerophosphoryl diester phosphodiesterase